MAKKLLFSSADSVSVGDVSFSEDEVVLIAGPCAVESETQVLKAAEEIEKHNLHFIRGGAFKPRTSPYSFQGLGKEGVRILHKVAKEFNLYSVSEVMDTADVQFMSKNIEVLQVGARNAQNFSLLKELSKVKNPVLLKRGFATLIDEYILTAEYLLKGGNRNIILCERGIRTFETATRNTLDISSVPIIKSRTRLPIIVDPTHASGRKDILLPLSKAAIAAGANGIMVEMHPNPRKALSDRNQQMSPHEFEAFIESLRAFCHRLGKEIV